jgi:hypothetical protein
MPHYRTNSDLHSSVDATELLRDIIDHSVKMPEISKFHLTPVVNWCQSQFGIRRDLHPIYGIGLKNVPNFKGKWAYTIDDEERANFWFKNYDDQTLFKLTWIGNDNKKY